MMFIMQPHIICEKIQHPIITKRLRDQRARQRIRAVLGGIEDVMFRYKMSRAGMEGACEEGGEDEVKEGVEGAEMDEENVERVLDDDVYVVD